jgi:hypothetical protein
MVCECKALRAHTRISAIQVSLIIIIMIRDLSGQSVQKRPSTNLMVVWMLSKDVVCDWLFRMNVTLSAQLLHVKIEMQGQCSVM